MPQDKRPLGLRKPKKLPVNRIYQISDSLDKEAFNKFNAARIRFKDESDDDAYKLSKDLNKSRISDKENAARYRAIADKAVQKAKQSKKK